MYAKISKKGQVIIPKAIRETLKVENDSIKLKGIPGSSARDLAGSLKKYAKDYIPLKTIRKKSRVKL